MTTKSLSEDQPSKAKTKLKIKFYLKASTDPHLSDGAVRVLGTLLLKFHNAITDLCFPKVATIATASGISERKTKRCIAELVNADYLKRNRRFNKSNIYSFNWSMVSDLGCQDWHQMGTQVTLDGDTADTSNGDTGGTLTTNITTKGTFNLTPKRDGEDNGSLEEDDSISVPYEDSFSVPSSSSVADSLSEPVSEPVPVTSGALSSSSFPNQVTRGSSIIPFPPKVARHPPLPHGDVFEQFWSVCPKQEKMEQTKKQFLLAIKEGVSPQLLIDKMTQYAKTVGGKDDKWIAYPHNWLKDKRWTDNYNVGNQGHAELLQAYGMIHGETLR